MGCKCVEVMNVAELRDRIIAFIDKPQAMARAARVNSAWHEEAIRHLWRGAITGDWFVDAFFRYWETPCLEVLSDLARKPDRFHHYLLHTKHLTLWWEAWSTDQWAIPEATLWTPLSYTSHDIRFLRPRDMQIEQPIRHLLKPNLTGLELGQNQRTAQSMQDIKTIAADLRWLQFEISLGSMVQAGSSDMISFLRDMPHLKAIELKRSLDQDLEMAILQRRNLTVLHINDATELHYALPDVVANPTSTFSLRELKIDDIVTPRKTYRLLLSRLPSLEVFELGLTSSSTTTGHIGEVVDITQDLLNPLLNCTGLRKLKIHDEYGDSEH